ncbi:hypothetical protein Bpfe_016953, partial [Biomphalaria pfeifferi]
MSSHETIAPPPALYVLHLLETNTTRSAFNSTGVSVNQNHCNTPQEEELEFH